MTASAISASIAAGAILGLLLVAGARARRARGRALIGYGLVVAAIIYVGFPIRSGRMEPWLGAELLGVALFGSIAWLGLRGSAWWLAAGWAAHTLWDVLLHHVGPGAGMAPVWYVMLCVGFDLAVALGVATLILRAHPAFAAGASRAPG